MARILREPNLGVLITREKGNGSLELLGPELEKGWEL